MMKNKMLLMLVVCLAMTATTFADIDYNATTEISTAVDIGTNADIGKSAAGTINITSTGSFTCTGGKLGEDKNGTINVAVDGNLYMNGEVIFNEGEHAALVTRLTVYGTAYLEQMKLAAGGNDNEVVVGNGTDAATLTTVEGYLGKYGDANITINDNSTMYITGGAGWTDAWKIDQNDAGTDSYIYLNDSGTLKVHNEITTTWYDSNIKGNGVVGNWVMAPGTGDDAGYNIYTAIDRLIHFVPFDNPWFPGEPNIVTVNNVTATLENFVAAGTPAWSVVSEPIADAATFDPDDALVTDVTFTAEGVYILKLEVADDGEPYSATLEVTVYENGCLAAKGKDYDEVAAREIGDTNYDCEVKVADLAAMALNWLADDSPEPAHAKFEIIALPDTENYVDPISNAWVMAAQTQWIVDQKATENIVFVSQLGDLLHYDAANEIVPAKAAFDILDGGVTYPDAVVPYSVSAGNHDGSSQFADNFGEARYRDYSWYGDGDNTTDDSYNTKNHYQIFSAEGYEFLHINLKKGPSAAVLAWAQTVVDANLGKPTIISTHDYLKTTGMRSGTGNDIWNGLVKDNPQIFMTLNGHQHDRYPASAHLLSENTAGEQVLQILANFEDYRGASGETDSGYMSRVIFNPDGKMISVKTFSPTEAAAPWLTDSAHQYYFDADFLTQVNGVASRPIGVSGSINNTNDCAYGAIVARAIGDTNYDCEVNLVDFAAMASNWLADESL